MKGRPIIPVALLVVVAIVATTLARAAAPDESSSSSNRPTTTTVRTSDDPGAELVALLTRSRSLTYNAAYAVRSDDPEVAGGSLTLEVWRKAPKVRQDSENVVDGRQARTATIKDTRIARCQQPAGGEWSCVRAPDTETGEFDNLLDRVKAEVDVSRVVETRESINGRNARCFNLSSKGGDVSQVCVDADGVPMRVASADYKLEITRFTKSVNDRVFDPPAPVAEG